jgi:hypothetical protein
MTIVTREAVETVGISPKAILAVLFPFIGTIVLVLLEQYVVGDMDPTLKVAIVGAVDALLAYLGAYVGKPGEVRVPSS